MAGKGSGPGRSNEDNRKPGRFRVDRADLPMGVERVLYLAATEPGFRRALLRDRRAALSDRRLTLRPSERALLLAVPQKQLEANILGIDPSRRNVERRSFLKVVALTSATMAAGRAALGGGACEGSAEAAARLRPLAVVHDGGAVGGPGPARFSVFIADRGLIQRFSVFLELEVGDPSGVTAALISPAGTRIRVFDGERSPGIAGRKIRGWYGADGAPPVESLAVLADEPVQGVWALAISGAAAGRLVRWRLAGQVSDESGAGAYSTYSQYGVSTEPSGCQCDPFSLEDD